MKRNCRRSGYAIVLEIATAAWHEHRKGVGESFLDGSAYEKTQNDVSCFCSLGSNAIHPTWRIL